MTSTHDEPGNPALPHPASLAWPGRERRRAAQPEQHGGDQAAAPAPAIVSEYGPAQEYRVADLDAGDRALLLALAAKLRIDQRGLADRFYVGRTRRGHIVLLTEYDVDDRTGEPVTILGVPIPRHYPVPVDVVELPVVCRGRR